MRKIRITKHLFLSTWISKGVAEAILNDIWDPFHAEALKAAIYGPEEKAEKEVQRLLVRMYQDGLHAQEASS